MVVWHGLQNHKNSNSERITYTSYDATSITIAAGSANAFSISLSGLPTAPTGKEVWLVDITVSLQNSGLSWGIYSTVTALAMNTFVCRIFNQSSASVTLTPKVYIFYLISKK